MKKSKYQFPYPFWFSYYQSMLTILISAAFRCAAFIRGESLIRGRRLFLGGYPKVRCLLEDNAYLRPDAY